MKTSWLCIVGIVVLMLLSGALGAEIALLHHPGSDYYEDVAIESPHNDDIGWAREAGIARGFSDTLYGPTWEVPREQMATFEVRDFTAGIAFALTLYPYLRTYYDSPIPDRPPLQMTTEEIGDLLGWTADLLDYSALTRPSDAIGGPAMYPDASERLRHMSEWYGFNTE